MKIAITTRGRVGADSVDEARAILGESVEGFAGPVPFARVTLKLEPDPARERPATAKASLDCNGRMLRAHVAAETMPQALAVLRHRLADQLDHLAQRTDELRHRDLHHEAGEWHRWDVPSARAPYFDRHPEEREIVRRKAYSISALDVDGAIREMELLDQEFHLFVDASTGCDAAVAAVDGAYQVSETQPVEPGRLEACVAPVAAAPAAPELTVRDAMARLDTSGERFVFFRDPADGRGHVLYRRYDGDYGLLSPVPRVGAQSHAFR